MTSAEKNTYSFSDKPITKAEEDCLGSIKYSQALAKSLVSWTRKDCLVIGLYGSWGNGKTSIKNLALGELKNSFQESISFLEYNPWCLDGSRGLVESFFNKLGTDLETSSVDKLKEASGKMKSLGALAGAGIPALTVLSNVFAPGSGPILEALLKKVPDLVSRDAEALIEKAQKSFESITKELHTVLNDLKKPLLIVVDDIDRLHPDEIRTLFKLIKNTADFPNVIYLLLFDKEVVISALNDKHGIKGKEYLQKIVQVDLDIPKITEEQLRSYANEKLKEIYSSKKIDIKESELFKILNLVPKFATNLRSIHRLINSYTFQLSLALTDGEPIVNPVDLLGLDVLRIFESKTFDFVFENISILAPNDLIFAINSKDAESNRFKSYWAELQNLFPEKHEHINQLFSVLFPSFSKIAFDEKIKIPSEEEKIKCLRLCHERLSKRYFNFIVEREDLSQKEVNDLLQSFKETRTFKIFLEKLSERGLSTQAIGYLLDYASDHDLNAFYGNLPVLLRHFEEYDGPLSDENRRWTIQLIQKCLLKENSLKRRSNKLKRALKDCGAYYSAILFIQITQENPNKALLSEADITVLKKWIITNIQTNSANGKLPNREKLGKLIYVWETWGDSKKLKAFLKRISRTPAGLLAFAYSQHFLSYSDEGERLGVNLKNLTRFVELNVIEKSFKKIARNELDNDDLRIYEAIERALKSKNRSSHPTMIEDDIWDDNE